VFGVSERRACRVTGQQRTTQRHARRVLAPEEALRARLREIAQTWPRYGFRRAWALLRNEGWLVNRKRVQRLWREEGLRVPASVLKRRRLGTSTVPASRLSAERPNHVWALDFIFDATSDGPPIKALSMCDEFTRENLARRLGRSITADEVIHALDDACVVRGAPEFIRMDNGPEFVVNAEHKEAADLAVDRFVENYGAKYPKATGKLLKDREVLLTHYDFPAEHWIHLRTTNAIESTIATVRLRTRKTKGAGSRAAGLAMAYKLLDAAQARWRCVNAPHLVALVRADATFVDGIKVEREDQRNAA
jgi:transposase InsO family protein